MAENEVQKKLKLLARSHKMQPFIDETKSVREREREWEKKSERTASNKEKKGETDF